RSSRSDSDQGFREGQDFANFDGGNPGILERAGKRAGVFGGDRYQQPPGSLRVEEKRADVVRNQRIVANQALGKVTIRFEPAGNVAGADAIERALSTRMFAEWKTRLTFDPSAISRAWPIKPKPVMSVRAWTDHVGTAALG